MEGNIWKQKMRRKEIADDADGLHNLDEMEHSETTIEDLSQQQKKTEKNGQRLEGVKGVSTRVGKEMV